MVKILLDSGSDGKFSHPHDFFVPLTVDIGGRVYKDGVDLRPQRFYKLLTTVEEFPKTSQPSPDVFAACFEAAKQSGDEVVYLALSGGLSGTLQSATIAKAMVAYDHIHIVDTKTATHMIGLLARYATKLAEEGLSGAEIVEKVTQVREKQVIYAGLETLEYLHKGGRLSKASAAIGTIANIKPIITVTAEGKVDTYAKSIGVKRAIQTIVKQVKEHEIDEEFDFWILYSEGEENCDALEAALTAAGISVSGRVQVGPTIGAHVGPGVYGVTYITK